MLQTILSIAGKPGLYKLVSRAKNSLIVEALDETHKRQPAFATDRVTSLADIAMFTESEDMPLGQVWLRFVTMKAARRQASIGARHPPKSLQNILPPCCPTMTATVYTTATSKNCCSGTTYSSTMASPSLRKTLLLPMATTLTTGRRRNNR